MTVLGLIPARGGSKGLPGKNLLPLGGTPLLALAARAAKEARRVSRVAVSTEDPAIAACARAAGAEVVDRPAALAGDETPMLDVVLHALDALAGPAPDVVCLLQPTSPLRRAEHVDEALAALEASGADAVVSVVELPHAHSPYKVQRLEGGLLSPFWTGPAPSELTRRQDVPTLYARNGPAVLACRVPFLRRSRSFYAGKTVPYLMSAADSVDVDTASDLRLAEALWAARGAR